MTQPFAERSECPGCGYLAAKAERESTNHLRCPGCQLIYRERMTSVIAETNWDAKYYSDDRVIEHYETRTSAFEKIVKLVNRRVGTPGTWLDIGCGVGSLLAVAEAAAWIPLGIEPSRIAVEVARARLARPNVVRGTVESALAQFREVNVASLVDVARYLERPVETLAAVGEALAPGGWAVVREGKQEAGKRRRAKEPRGYEPPCARFVQEWTPEAMETTLRRAGFTDIHCFPSPAFTETTGWERGGRPGFRGRVEMMMRMGVWPVSRIVHRMSFGHVYVSPSFLAIARRPHYSRVARGRPNGMRSART